MAPAPMLVRLNRETREHHADADSAWHELLVQDVTRDRYMDQLIRVYGFEAPLEGALAYAPAMDTAKRREHARSGRIVEDLLVLGLRPAQISDLPQCREIAPFSDFHTALGWLYALERATLIHGMLRRHLIATLPDIARATKYLGASEGSIANRWRELGVAFEDAGEHEEHASKVIQAATAALTAQRRWFTSTRQASAAGH